MERPKLREVSKSGKETHLEKKRKVEANKRALLKKLGRK